MPNKCGLTSLYCDEYIDFTKQKMFFGKGKNLQRYDVFAREIFDQINKTMQSFFWRPEEVDLTKDSMDIQGMEEHELHILTRTLQKLIFLDSIMGRGPFLTLGQVCTIPELEGAILTWDFFESIHSRSYSWILQNCYPDPSIIFDEISSIKEISAIADFISGYYNDFYNDIIEIQYHAKHNSVTPEMMNKTKKSMLLLLMAINCLEGIEFLSGFSAVWGLTEAKSLVPGNTKILQFIARDELQHLRLTQNICSLLRNDKSEGFYELWQESTTEFYNIYLKAIELEYNFVDMLYSKGSIIGMNADIAKEYLQYVANDRLKKVGLKTMFDITKNPIPWINPYYKFSSTIGALQEIESTDYKQGGILFDGVPPQDIYFPKVEHKAKI